MVSRPCGFARVVLLVIGVVLGVALASSANAQVIHSFATSGAVADTGLVVGRDGWLYGTRAGDGDFAGGTVFRVEVTGAGFEVLHHFSGLSGDGVDPSGPLVEGAPGIFYGTTTGGGLNGGGTLFKLDMTASQPVVVVVHHFDNFQGVPYGGVTLASDGLLYGTASSTPDTPDRVYRIASDGTGYQPLYPFPGSVTDLTDPGRLPQGVIEGSDGLLYGATWNGPDLLRGKVFRMAKDGNQFQVLAEAPGRVVAPPVEIESGGDRWIYVVTAEGPGTFPTDAPNGSIFRVLADGSFSERVHTFDPTNLNLGAPPTGRLVRIPGQAGVYGLTSEVAGACSSGSGCGSVYRAIAPNPYPLHVFQNTGGDGITPQGAITQAPNGRLFALTNGGGQYGFGAIYVVSNPEAAPIELTGPVSVLDGGQATYAFKVANRNGGTLSYSPFAVSLRLSPGLSFVSESPGSGWSCLPEAGDAYRCNWPTWLAPGSDTAVHSLTFSAGPAPYPIDCQTGAGPCVSVIASVPSFGGVRTLTTQVEINNLSTGQTNQPPIAMDDLAFVISTTPVIIPVLDNDTNQGGETDALRISGIVDQPSQGGVVVNVDGTLTYTPFAPLTGPDTFRYRVTDPYGASAFATVTVTPIRTTLSKSVIDFGQMAPRRVAMGRTAMTNPPPGSGMVTYTAIPANELPSVLPADYLPDLAAGNVVFDASDFSGYFGWQDTNPAPVLFRSSDMVGRVSAARAHFWFEGVEFAHVDVFGKTVDSNVAPPRAMDDVFDVPVNSTGNVLDLLANDGPVGQRLYISSQTVASNYPNFWFDEAPEDLFVGDLSDPDLADFANPLLFTPPAGYQGESLFSYASSEEEACLGQPTCTFENNLYYALVTIRVGTVRSPDLRVTKTIIDGSGNPVTAITINEGDQVRFRLEAVNDAAAGDTIGPITIRDQLPMGLTIESAAGCAAVGQSVECLVNTPLAPGAPISFVIVARGSTGSAPAGASLTVLNLATVTTARDANPSDNVSPAVSVTILGPRRADLAVTISAAPNPVFTDETLTTTATVTNNGPNDAQQVRLVGFGALVAQTFRDVAITSPQGNCVLNGPGTQIECSFSDLAPGATAIVTVTAVPTMRLFDMTPGLQVDVPVVASVTTTTTDEVFGNNQGTATVTVKQPQADVAVALSISSPSVAVGQTITGTATVVNNGPQTATGVELRGGYPASNFTNVTVTSSAGTTCQIVSVPTDRVICTIGTLAPGATATVSYTGTAVSASASESLGVQVSSIEADLNEPNNSATATFAVTNTPVSTTPVTVPLTTSAGAPVPVAVTFSAVTSEGRTVADPISPALLPAGFRIASQTYEITTTAAFTPPVTVCIDGSFGDADVLLHGVGGSWVELPNQQRLPPGGPTYTRVCAETMTFSPFVVATRVNRAPTVNAGPDQTIEATSAAGAVAAVTGVASDLDGDTLTYTWSGACGGASGASASLSCPLGTNLVTLSVSDGQNPAVTDTLTMTVRDTTAPHVACGAANSLWHATDQTVTCTASDAVGVSPADASFALATTVAAGVETSTAMTIARPVCDAAGNCATAGPAGPFKIDRRGPAISLTAPASNASYTVGQAVTAAFTCTDGGSGVQSCQGTLANGAPIPTDTPGTFTFTVDAADQVGNTASSSVTYTVTARTFAFEGFFWPVQNPPVVNRVKAGSAIPVRFGLGGNRGLNIFAVGSPQVVQVACETGQPTGEVGETVTAGQSGLLYNPLTKRYIYIWKTQKSMAGACWRLTMQFTDGTSAFALFEMRK